MSTDDPSSGGFSLRRWSRRKLEAARAAAAPAPDAAERAPDVAKVSAPARASGASFEPAPPIADAVSLPPVESLTIDSDFSAYLDPKVDKALKLQALKRLFRDPHFNVMDGLDVYIDDYSIADPIAPELVRQLAQARYIFDPPRTRVTEAGVVEDVSAEESTVNADAAPPDALPESQVIPSAPATPRAASDAASDAAAESGAGVATPREGSEPARR
jgi:uncharacterized protein DUF3306